MARWATDVVVLVGLTMTVAHGGGTMARDDMSGVWSHAWTIVEQAWTFFHTIVFPLGKDGAARASTSPPRRRRPGSRSTRATSPCAGVTDGIHAAVDRARQAAGGADVAIAGGAQTVQQALAAGLLDELCLHIAPVVLGAGTRLLENVGDPTLEPVEAVHSPAVTHVRYRVVR